MAEEIKWLIGIGVAISLSVAGYIIAAIRGLSSQIKAGDDALHQRINRVRDEYVRRDDLADFSVRFENSIREMRQENRDLFKQMNERIDKIPHNK